MSNLSALLARLAARVRREPVRYASTAAGLVVLGVSAATGQPPAAVVAELGALLAAAESARALVTPIVRELAEEMHDQSA